MAEATETFTNRLLAGLRPSHYLVGAVVLLFVIWLGTYNHLSTEKTEALESAEVQSTRHATFFERHAATTFHYADDYIKAVRRIYLREGTLDAVRKYMAEVPPATTVLSHITLMNANGVPELISTGIEEKKIKPGTHARDRDYFKFQKSATGDEAYISVARKGRNTGIVTVRLVRRLPGPVGRFQVVIFAAVKATQLLSFFDTTRMGPNSSATLVGLDMIIRLRSAQGMGKKITGSRLWENLAKNPTGIYRHTSIIDGVPRMWAYRRVAEFPLVAVIGTAIPDILDAFDRERRQDLGVAGLTSLVVMVLTLLALREKAAAGRLAVSVAEQGRTEEELRRSNAQYQLLTDLSPDAVFVHVAGKVVFVNPAMEKLMGAASADRLIGMNALDIKHPDLRNRITKTRKEISDTGEPIELLDLRYRDLAGNAIDVDTAASPLKWEGRDGYLVVAHDVTERKKAEQALRDSREQLHQAQKMEAVGQLTGGVAHNFNNLLAVIQGNVEFLADELGPENSKAEAILRASKRGAELTQRLLAFSRRQPLRPVAIDLAKLTAGMHSLLVRTLGETIEVEIASERGLRTVLADPGQVENALLNLAINARDAMPDGGTLSVTCANARIDDAFVADHPEVVAGEYVVLEVNDTGTGMSPEAIEHAFEPFFTTKEVGEGSGLGLSMIYGFAKQSGGHVTIYSEEGHGTTVRLYLPQVRQNTMQETETQADDAPIGQGERILVIEDDPDVRTLVLQMLESLGYLAFDVSDAAAARNFLGRNEAVDLIVSDVILPGGMSGPEFAEDARADNPELRIIFMSGYPAGATNRNGLLNADEVLLTKPFRRAGLARAVRDALERTG